MNQRVAYKSTDVNYMYLMFCWMYVIIQFSKHPLILSKYALTLYMPWLCVLLYKYPWIAIYAVYILLGVRSFDGLTQQRIISLKKTGSFSPRSHQWFTTPSYGLSYDPFSLYARMLADLMTVYATCYEFMSEVMRLIRVSRHIFFSVLTKN